MSMDSKETVIRREIVIYALLAVIGLALLAHVFFPRYDWRTVQNPTAVSIVIYDRWTGRFQRAVYDDKGALNVMGVYVPF